MRSTISDPKRLWWQSESTKYCTGTRASCASRCSTAANVAKSGVSVPARCPRLEHQDKIPFPYPTQITLYPKLCAGRCSTAINVPNPGVFVPAEGAALHVRAHLLPIHIMAQTMRQPLHHRHNR